jgi:hypothetical protein
MDMIRSAMDGMKPPAPATACLAGLLFNDHPLFIAQPTRVFRHLCRSLDFAYPVRELPAVPVLRPPSCVTREPRAVRGPRQKVANGIPHDRISLYDLSASLKVPYPAAFDVGIPIGELRYFRRPPPHHNPTRKRGSNLTSLTSVPPFAS